MSYFCILSQTAPQRFIVTHVRGFFFFLYQTYFFINLPFLGRVVFECAVCRRSPQRCVASLPSRSGELMSCRASTIISNEHQRGERVGLRCALKSPTFKGQYAVTLKANKDFLCEALVVLLSSRSESNDTGCEPCPLHSERQSPRQRGRETRLSRGTAFSDGRTCC